MGIEGLPARFLAAGLLRDQDIAIIESPDKPAKKHTLAIVDAANLAYFILEQVEQDELLFTNNTLDRGTTYAKCGLAAIETLGMLETYGFFM
jgi:hypothetical protein